MGNASLPGPKLLFLAFLYVLHWGRKRPSPSHRQGYPSTYSKLVSSMWMGTPAGGLVTVAYGPSEVHTKMQGTEVSVREETRYPFGGEIKFTVHAGSPVQFPLVLRVPKWAENM